MSKNIKVNGINHLALSTSNMKEQITFFTDVLGMRLVALYWMHVVEGCWHGFLEMNENSALAFVFNPANAEAKIQPGVTQPTNMTAGSAPGTMQHVALNVDTLEELLNIRDRIRSRGVNVNGPIDHGMCHSIYFHGPEDISLEVATYGNAQHPIGADTWVDPEVQALAGISDEELQKFTNPSEYPGQGGAVPQPEYNPDGYHPKMPEEILKALIKMPDDMVAKQFSEPRPPALMNAEERAVKRGKD